METDMKKVERIVKMKPEQIVRNYFWFQMTTKEKINYYLKKMERCFLFVLRCFIPVISVVIVLISVTSIDSGLNDKHLMRNLITQIDKNLPIFEKAYKQISSFGGAISKQRSSLNDDQAFVYAFLITKYSRQYGLDPYLVAGLTATESEFNPKAVSYAKAKGLMQIHQPTWKLPNSTLFDAEENIKHGVRILYMYRNSEPTHYLRGYGGFSDRYSEEAKKYESKVKRNTEKIKRTDIKSRKS